MEIMHIYRIFICSQLIELKLKFQRSYSFQFR